jgi:hypothetical protein
MQWEVVDAFMATAREGDFGVLDPDVVVRADAGAPPAGMSREIRGGGRGRAGGARVLAARPVRATERWVEAFGREGFQNYSSPGRRGVHRRESQFWNPSDRGVQIVTHNRYARA